MDKLQQIFVGEAQQLINDLERALLEFEQDTTNARSVQEIFRVMHTLKGSASMFGFESLSAITHDIETLYDGIRNGKLKPNADILAVTLEVVDHLKVLITDQRLETRDTLQKHQNLLQRIKLIVPATANNEEKSTPASNTTSTYYINYKPDREVFKNGTNPLFLIDDLYAIGNACVFPYFNEVPHFSDITEHCYAGFEVLLSTASHISAIKEVFIFVENTSAILIEKISDGDVKAPIATKFFSEKKISAPPIGWPAIGTATDVMEHSALKQETRTSSIQTRIDASSIRVDSNKLDELMNLISELVTCQARLSLISEQNGINDLTSVSETIEKITRRLRDNAFNICLVQIDTLAVRFQRLVRDVSKELQKEISFTTEGLDTEIDRSVIEKVTDPILHILRNCIDHGIEIPDQRIAKGKKREGRIHFKAYHLGTHVHIEISDDGKGIDVAYIREKAIAKGLITSQDQLTDNEVLNLIFLPGFSTVDKVTDLSGRGVGMDIVKRNIESIHGEVSLKTVPDEGTTILIRLPLTLSIMDGMLVEVGGTRYLLPLTVIDKCYEIPSDLISPDPEQKHVFDDTLLPVLNLHQVFRKRTARPAVSQVIKVHFDFPVGITVDTIIGEYQAVMKPLGEMFQKQDEFSGATILGDGSVALVLDTTTLIRQLITNSN